MLLFTAARRDHLERTIKPALDAGQIVLCDRFVDSTRAYQGTQDLRRATDTVHDLMIGLSPDLTLIFDMDPGLAAARAGGRGGTEDRFERKGLAFQEKLRDAFLTIAQANPTRCHVINAEAPESDVAAQVWTCVEKATDLMADDDALPQSDQVPGHPHPRETLGLFGQDAAVSRFIEAWSGDRLHHAWLLRGPSGVGKATLAYRIARALIAQPPPGGLFGDPLPSERTLDTPPDCPVQARIAALGEPPTLCSAPGMGSGQKAAASADADFGRQCSGDASVSANVCGGWWMAGCHHRSGRRNEPSPLRTRC